MIRFVLSSSSFGGATHVTGSFITPQVRRMGPEGLRGLLVKGLTIGTERTTSVGIFLVVVLSLALLRSVPSPGLPARLKSKQVRSALSPRNLAICGFDLNFFPQGLEGETRKHFKVKTCLGYFTHLRYQLRQAIIWCRKRNTPHKKLTCNSRRLFFQQTGHFF